MTLTNADLGKAYKVTRVVTEDEDFSSFLFSLGCYSGEEIVVVSHVSGNYVVSIRDGRYNIDPNLATAIHVA